MTSCFFNDMLIIVKLFSLAIIFLNYYNITLFI